MILSILLTKATPYDLGERSTVGGWLKLFVTRKSTVCVRVCVCVKTPQYVSLQDVTHIPFYCVLGPPRERGSFCYGVVYVSRID